MGCGEITPIKNILIKLIIEFKILIPGCGNSYEAEYLFKNNFQPLF